MLVRSAFCIRALQYDARKDSCQSNDHSTESAIETRTCLDHTHDGENNRGYPKPDFEDIENEECF